MEFEAFSHLRKTMDSYYALSEQTWQGILSISKVRKVKKGERLVEFGDVPTSIFFSHIGLYRAYIISEDDAKEVNKNFFAEGRFPASIAAALTQSESSLCIEALENGVVIELDHKKYRNLLDVHHDLKWYHIVYLERHWLLEKDPLVTSLLSQEAKERYQIFKEENPGLVDRIPLYHLASNLGITPTQLSRIRKNLKN